MTAAALAIWGLLKAIYSVVGLRGLLVGAAIAFAVYWHSSRVSEAYDDGAQTVRIEWQEANRRAELAALERQKKQQAEINQAEIDLLNSRALSATRIQSLEEALEAERATDGKPVVDRRDCNLPDRVREALRYRNP